jgi:hypothetical protein
MIAWFAEFAPDFESLINPISAWENPANCELEKRLVSLLEAEKTYMDQWRSYLENEELQTLNKLHDLGLQPTSTEIPELIAYESDYYGEEKSEAMSWILRLLSYRIKHAHEILEGHPVKDMRALKTLCEEAYKAQGNEFRGECPVIIDMHFGMRHIASFPQVNCIEFRNLKLSQLEYKPIGGKLIDLTVDLQDHDTLTMVRFGEGCELDEAWVNEFFEPRADGWYIIKRDYDPKIHGDQGNRIRDFLHKRIEDKGEIDTYVQSDGSASTLIGERNCGNIIFAVDESRLPSLTPLPLLTYHPFNLFLLF